jgi:hypothetical protein
VQSIVSPQPSENVAEHAVASHSVAGAQHMSSWQTSAVAQDPEQSSTSPQPSSKDAAQLIADAHVRAA